MYNMVQKPSRRPNEESEGRKAAKPATTPLSLSAGLEYTTRDLVESLAEVTPFLFEIFMVFMNLSIH